MAQEWTKVEGAAKNDAGEYQVLVGGKWQPASGAAKNDAGEYMALMDSTPAAPVASVMDNVKSVPSAVPGNNGIQFGSSGLSTVSTRAQDIAIQRAAKPKIDGPAPDTMAATSDFIKGSGSPLIAEQSRVNPKPEVGLANAVESSGRYVDKVNADRMAERSAVAEASPYTSSLGAGAAQILSNVADTPAFVNDALKTFVVNPILHIAGQEGMEPTQRFAIAKDLQQAADEFTPKTGKLMDLDFNNPQEVGHWVAVNALKNAPQIATGYAASVIPKLRAAYLGLMGVTSGAGQYQRNLENGVNQKDAMLDGVTNGAFEVIGEMTGFAAFDKIGGMIKAMPVGQRAAVAQEAIKKLMVGVAATAGQMTAEGAGEGITQVGQNLSQKYVAGDKSVGLMDGVPDAVAIGAIMGTPTALHQGAQAARQPQSDGAALGQALQDSVDNTQLDPRAVTSDALRARSPTGSLPVPLTKMAADFSASQKAKATGVPHEVIAHPEDPTKFTAVPEQVAQDIAQKTQPVSIPNGDGIPADEILGAGPGVQESAMSADDAAILQGAQEQGVALQEDHIGITPESLDNLFASQRAQHAAAITQPEVMYGASITPAAPGLDATPAEQWGADATGSAPDSLRGNEGGINATGDRLAGQPDSGAQQPDAGLAGADNAVAARIDAAAHEAATSPLNDLPEPTQAMKEAGNYKKAHVSLHGLDIAIENPKGSQRSGIDPDGKPWSIELPDHYGYIKRTKGADGDHVDTYIGGNPESRLVYVVDQVHAGTGKFDEHKVMLGYNNASDAMDAYRAAFNDGKGHERMGAVAEMNVDQFKNWLAEGDTKKPLAPQMQNTPAQKKAPAVSENLLARIKQLGGINLSHIRDVTGENNPKNVRAVGLFSKAGKGLDDLAVMLHDDGFDVGMHDQNDNGGVNRLSDQIRSALDGNPVLTIAATERKAAADADAEHNHNVREQAKALGIKTVARKMEAIEADVVAHEKAKIESEEKALSEELSSLGKDLDSAILEAQSIIGEQDVSTALRYAGERIENEQINNEAEQIRIMIASVHNEIRLRREHEQDQNADIGQLAAESAGSSGEAGGSQASFGGNREAQSGSFELTGQSPAEITAAERAQAAQDSVAREDEAKAKAEQAKRDQDAVDAKVKARTDNADNFQFGESSRDASSPVADLFRLNDDVQQPSHSKIQKENEARKKADADFDDAMSDFGDIFGKNFRATFTPEQEQKIIPVLTRLFDAAFRKGYYKFKDAARFVLDSISSRIGKEVADEITIDHLQGAYIGMAGRYKEQGADSKRDVVAFESKDELGESNVTDKRSGTNLERDSKNTNTSDGVGAQGVRDGRNGDGGTGGQRVLDAEREGGARRGDGVSGRDATPDGERGNLEIYTGAPADEASIARDSINQRSDSAGVDGPPIESDATSVAEELAESGISLEKARSEQRAADKQEHKPGIENIRATLPILTEAQQDDVAIAETRFAKPDGYGMLFTNGTGTGKTFTGLGIIKRFVAAGKSNIIITVPNDKIADDWKKAGRLLGLDITRLPDTKSAGSGVVIATYANFGQNNELAIRNWDLIVHDEAHYLAMDKDGTNTLSLHNLRAISMNPAGASTRASMLHADLIENLAKVRGDIKSARESGDDRSLIKLPPLEAKEKALAEKFRAAVEAVKSDVASKQGAARPRVLFLSATPFAYEKTVDWANGYLFDYNEGRGNEGGESRGYNAGNNRDQFMMQNFGYRMRYGKLTAPDAKVDSGLMQRQFNTMLKKSGVLSGRMLDVKADYDRRFVLVDSAIGRRIDAALQWFEDQRTGGKDEKQIESDAGKSRSEALRDLRDVIGEKFDYLSRRYLLEAIKAQEVIPHVKEHMALGRKVVVFHDYKKGGGFNPFNVSSVQAGGDVDPARASAFNAAVREFRAEFKDLIESDVWHASSPITAFQQAFSGTTHPKVLLFNGDVSAKDRRAAVEKFQDDTSGPQVILVQSAAGKEGISLHDTTGKYQRVLFNLGQPTQPTTAIQQEGRIYRTGQATDAIFRYLNTGTNWEKWAFATTIAQRASAAENLGMGEQARALKDAFITGFEESDDYRAGMDGEGKGGKERDKAANNALTEYDRARSFYFGTQKKNSRTKAQEGADYFATPEPVGLKMVELADIRPGESALEPSAGHGAIARWMPTTAERSAIEPSTVLRPRLAMVFDGKIIGSDFEDMHVSNKFDAIVMNPPFGVGGKTAVEHLSKAATHLRDGGRIVALIPQGSMADKRFDKWMYSDEEQRPVKPLFVRPDFGPIFRGDTITFSSFGGNVDLVVWNIDDHGAAQYAREKGSSVNSAINLVAAVKITPTGARTESYSPSKGFHLVADIKMPSVTFERAGTAVNTRIVVIEKSDTAPQQATRDYSNIDDINELFNRMESLSISPRAKAAEVAEEAAPAKRESKVAALDAQAKAKEAEAAQGGKIAESNSNASFEIKDGKLVTNAPTEKVITGKGKELEGVFVPFDKLTQAQVKEADAFTYMPKGKSSGWFVRLRHVERPAVNFDIKLSTKDPLADIRARYLAATKIGLSVNDVKSATAKLRMRWHGFRKVSVVQSLDDLPADIRSGALRSGASDVEGVYDPKTKQVFLVADNLRSADRAAWVAIHEVVGHAGLRMLDTKVSEKIDYLAKNATVQKLAKAIATDREELFDQPTHSEEAVAELAAAYLTNGEQALFDRYGVKASGIVVGGLRGMVNSFVSAVRKFISVISGRKIEEVSDADVRAVIDKARKAVETGAGNRAAGEPLGLVMASIGESATIDLDSPMQPVSAIPDETEFQKRQRQVQDKMNRFAVLQKWLKFKGVSLSEKADVHANENLMHAKIANQTQDFRDHVETPLIERAAKAGFKLADIADYLEAQHIPEANARMRDIHHDASATANGITDAEANQALAEFQAMPKFAEFKKLADDFRSIGDETLNLRLREGLISREQYDAYKGTYQHWVPLRGDGKKPGVGKGLSVNAKEKRRLGHGQREDGEMVIENLLMDRERAIYQVEHNRVGKSIIQFALEAKEPDMITVGKPEKRQIMKDQQVYEVQYKGRMMRAFSSESDAKSFINQAIALSSSRQGGGMARSNFSIAKSNDPMVIMQASPMLAENEIQVYVAGHTIRVQLNDELLARAATNMGVDQVNSLLAAGRTINNGLSKIYTAYSPDFIFRNAIRDFIAGTINLTGDMGVKMAGKIYANYGRAAKELFVARNDPLKSAWVQHYRAAGGNTGAAYLSDIERIGADAQAAMYEHMKGMAVYRSVHHKLISEGRNQVYAHTAAAMKTGVAKFSSIPVLGHFLSLIEHLNAVTENALRLATYMTLVQNGYTEQQAAVAAKNSTVNFNRKGEISNVMGAAYLFFNPSVQGSTRMFSSLLKSEHKGQAQAMAGMLAFAAFALAELGRGGDDDDERNWKNIPDHVKDHNLIFKFGDLQYTIPVPYEFAPFHVLGNSISNSVHGESGWKASMKVLKSLVDNLSPLGDPFAGEGKDGANLFQLTPTVVKMVLAPHENQNSFASPIQPEKNSFSKNKPDSQNMFRNTEGSLYAGAAEWVNEITGGSAYKSGGVDVSPEVLKFWVSTLTGGTGRFVADTGDAIWGAANGVAPELRNTPIARVFVREASVADARSRFWEAANEAKVAADELSMARKDHNSSAVKEIRDAEGDMIRLSKMADRMGKAASKKRDAIDAIRQDDQMPLEQKREQMKAIEQKEGEYYDRFLKMFDQKHKERRDRVA